MNSTNQKKQMTPVVEDVLKKVYGKVVAYDVSEAGDDPKTVVTIYVDDVEQNKQTVDKHMLELVDRVPNMLMAAEQFETISFASIGKTFIWLFCKDLSDDRPRILLPNGMRWN
jgi:hypothetical protein